ncbi:hypothetical protein TNCV_1095351 [Trichonephila clavipes]|nr:hypothetical protein TNCV_1095351 [Trichonephila clavipes]
MQRYPLIMYTIIRRNPKKKLMAGLVPKGCAIEEIQYSSKADSQNPNILKTNFCFTLEPQTLPIAISSVLKLSRNLDSSSKCPHPLCQKGKPSVSKEKMSHASSEVGCQSSRERTRRFYVDQLDWRAHYILKDNTFSMIVRAGYSQRSQLTVRITKVRIYHINDRYTSFGALEKNDDSEFFTMRTHTVTDVTQNRHDAHRYACETALSRNIQNGIDHRRLQNSQDNVSLHFPEERETRV